jgi:hypothetical protein
VRVAVALGVSVALPVRVAVITGASVWVTVTLAVDGTVALASAVGVGLGFVPVSGVTVAVGESAAVALVLALGVKVESDVGVPVAVPGGTSVWVGAALPVAVGLGVPCVGVLVGLFAMVTERVAVAEAVRLAVAAADPVALGVAGSVIVALAVGVAAAARIRFSANRSGALMRPSWLASAVAQSPPANSTAVSLARSAPFTTPSQFASPGIPCACAALGPRISASATSGASARAPTRRTRAWYARRPPPCPLSMLDSARPRQPH